MAIINHDHAIALLTHCGRRVTSYGVNGTKPLPEPVLVIIGVILWHWSECNFTVSVQDIYHWYEFENY